MKRAAIIKTNIGDLIAALVEEAASYVRDENDLYKVVAFMLAHLLNNSAAIARAERYSQ